MESEFVSQTRVAYDIPGSIVYERKFDTAIRSTYSAKYDLFLMTGTPNNPFQTWFRAESIARLGTEKGCADPTYVACLVDVALTRQTHPPLRLAKKFNRTTSNVADQVLSIQVRAILENYWVSNKYVSAVKWEEFRNTITIPPLVLSLLDLSTFLSGCITTVAMLQNIPKKLSEKEKYAYCTKYGIFEDATLGIVIIYEPTLLHIRIRDTTWLCPAPCLLMLHNKLCDLVSVLLLSYFSQHSSLPHDAYVQTVQFVKHLITLNLKYKNKYFTIAKSLESLVVAETLVSTDDWNNMEFLNSVADELYNEIQYDYHGSELQYLIQAANIPLRHELGCLSKILGHPFVDMEAGAKALYKKTHEVYELDLIKINRCECYIKLNYIQNHILRYRRWPPAMLENTLTPHPLLQAFVRGKDPYDPWIVKKYGAVDVTAMSFVTILPNERFHKLENVIPYLKDKTITLMRSKVLAKYINFTDPDKGDWKETRLLLAYLLNPCLLHDHLGYIERYDSSEELDELLNFLVIRIVPKEKELKTVFRGFGAKTYEDRMRALAQEKTCMDYLNKYCDEQAMTLGELQISRRLCAFRNLKKAYVGHKILYIVIDASSWNNHFRSETVDHVMEETLDKVHNTHIFSKTHQAFQKSLIYVPNIPESFYWHGQGGGIEGLNQDTWVVTYIAQIKTALEGLDLKYHILCKGDDLRVAVALPSRLWRYNSISAIKNTIVTRIADTMQDFGHEIKVLESYGSATYFAFSKTASVRNIELPQGFRKIQKCYGASNAFINTLDEYIGSSMSNCHSTCRVEPGVIPSYLVGLIWCIYYLVHSKFYQSATEDELTALMLIPGLGGGFPIIFLHNLIVRAESDLLSPFLHLYIFCDKYYPNVAQVMANFMQTPLHDRSEPPIMLMRDPYSIPSSRPTLPSAVLRSYVVPCLKRWTKNDTVRELIAAAESDDMIGFLNCFNSVSYYNAKVISALFSATPLGVLDELTRKFESARSINELLIKTSGPRKAQKILRHVARSEVKLQRWRMNMARGVTLHNSVSYQHLVGICPAQSAHQIRRVLWGREIHGITMPPLQHQTKFMNALALDATDWDNLNHFSYKLSHPTDSLSPYGSMHYSTGAKTPFIGYTTRTGMTDPTLQFIEKDPVILKLKNLLDLVSWTNTSGIDKHGDLVASNSYELIKAIVKTYTDTPITSMLPFGGLRRSGTVQHHLRAPHYRESIVPNTLGNLYTRFSGESNSHVRYRTSRFHYLVNFLHIYCYSAWVGNIELEWGPSTSTPEEFWCVTTDCNFCNTPIQDEPYIFDLTHIQHISLHPLAISSVGENALDIIKESMEIVDMNAGMIEPLPVETLPLEAAVIGILSEVIDHTYGLKRAVQIRYGHPQLSNEGYDVMRNLNPLSKSRDIGQSEFKRLPLVSLVDSLINIVVYYTYSVVRTTPALQTSLWYLLIPGKELPWYGVVDAIYRSGRLMEVITQICTTAGLAPSSSGYNPDSASKFLGKTCIVLIDLLNIPTYTVILSYYMSDSVTVRIKQTIFSILNKTFSSVVGPFLTTRRIQSGQDSEEMMIRVIRAGILILGGIYTLEEEADSQTMRVMDQKETHITIDYLALIPPETLMDMFEDIEISNLYLSRKLALLKNHPQAHDSALQDIFDTWDEHLMDLRDIYKSHKVQVVITTGVDCINRVRSEPYSPDNLNFDLDTLRVREDYIADLRPSFETTIFDRPIVLMEHIKHVKPVGLPELEYITKEDTICPVDISAINRYYGIRSGSSHHLYYILTTCLKYQFQSHRRYSICCLSDGFGGFSQIMDIFFPSSTIVFHTYPEDDTSPRSCVSLDLAGGHKGVVLTSHLDEGYYDLSQISTLKRIKKYGLIYKFITCDMEVPEKLMWQYSTILSNIIHFYLTERSVDALLICKLQLSEASANCSALDYLRESCTHVIIVQPPTEGNLEYAYLLAYGWIKPTRDTICIDLTRTPSLDSSAYWNKFVKQVKHRVNLIRIASHKGINLLDGTLHASHITLNYGSYLPVRFYSVCINRLYLPSLTDVGESGSEIPNRTMVKISWNTCKDVKDLLSTIGFPFDRYRAQLRSHLEHEDYRTSSWIDSDTSGHRLYVLNHLSFVEGIMTVIGQFFSKSTPWIVSTDIIVNAYDRFLKNISTRDSNRLNMPSTDEDMHLTILDIERSFLSGVEIMMSLAGLFRLYTHAEEKARKKNLISEES